MRSLLAWLVSCSCGLLAQDVGKVPEPAAVTPSSAAAPRRFADLPLRDPAPLDVAAATPVAIARLLALQDAEAAQWPYRGVYREDRDPSPVGYRVGGTAIACLGLLAAPGYGADPARQAAVQRGLASVLQLLLAPRMAIAFEGTYDVRGWGHIYALQLLLVLHDRQLVPAECAEVVAQKTTWLVQALVESAIPEAGGWNYSRRLGYRNPRNPASTFMTAPALQVLFHAKARGHVVPELVVGQALDALERARAKPGGYAYGAPANSQASVVEDALTMMDKTPSSAARAAVIETTLQLAGRGDPVRLERAVRLFFDHWDDLAVRKSQPRTHIPPYGMAPYYFLFGHLYAAQAIEQVTDTTLRDQLRERMRVMLAKAREDDGSWNDRQFETSAGYGTALALLAMHMPESPAPLPWVPNAPK